MKITLKDGSVIEREKGVSCLDVAKSISEGLARAALAAVVDGKEKDLSYKLENDCTLSLLTAKD